MLRLTCVLAFAAVAASGAVAHAQTAMGSCTGLNLGGTVGLALRNSDGTFTTIATDAVPSAFSRADCQCNSNDINLQIQVTSPLPVSPQLTVEVWVGVGCDSYTTRTAVNQTQCEQLTTGVPQYLQFTSSASTSSPYIYIPIPAASLFSPKVNTCTTPTASNQIYVVLFSDPNMQAICKLSGLQEVTTSPQKLNPSAAPGDGRVSLSWPNPDVGQITPQYYQVLCATADGKVVPGKGGNQLAYSVCTSDKELFRRKIPTGGSLGTGTGTGTGGTADLGTANEPLGAGLGPEATESQTTFESLHPMYVCSDPIQVNGRNATISGLNNNEAYQFILVSVDAYGNPTASDVVTATPQPAEDLFQRYANKGGKASGFCFVATAAFGSYDSAWVKVLRDFRDEWLLTTPEGRAFVDWYYAHGPGAAKFLVEHPGARAAVRLALIPVVAVAAIFVYTTAAQKALALALLALLLWRRSRRAPRGGVA